MLNCCSTDNTYLSKVKNYSVSVFPLLVLFCGRLVGSGGDKNGNAVSSAENSLSSQGVLIHVLPVLGGVGGVGAEQGSNHTPKKHKGQW